MRSTLERSGVRFKRLDLHALSDARHLGHDVLINATGLGPRHLVDVQDPDMLFLKGQIILVKSDYKKCLMRDDGKDYTYVIPRLDGTVIMGGIRDPDIRYIKIHVPTFNTTNRHFTNSNTEVELDIDKDVSQIITCNGVKS